MSSSCKTGGSSCKIGGNKNLSKKKGGEGEVPAVEADKKGSSWFSLPSWLTSSSQPAAAPQPADAQPQPIVAPPAGGSAYKNYGGKKSKKVIHRWKSKEIKEKSKETKEIILRSNGMSSNVKFHICGFYFI